LSDQTRNGPAVDNKDHRCPQRFQNFCYRCHAYTESSSGSTSSQFSVQYSQVALHISINVAICNQLGN
jgi:hypothetical protein